MKVHRYHASHNNRQVVYFLLVIALIAAVVYLFQVLRYASVTTPTPPIPTDDFEDLHILHVNERLMSRVEMVYVIPGGGSSGDSGYPEWTRRRTEAAFEQYAGDGIKDKSIFVALSAGSLNAPNVLFEDKRTMFECQHVIDHLTDLGVPAEHILGDTFSYDTVTNGLTLRMILESIQMYRSSGKFDMSGVKKKKVSSLHVTVFISDFHADRVKETFDWVLNLQPAVANIELNINSVTSLGIEWPSPMDFNQRLQHEQESIEKIRNNRKLIRTVSQFHAFLTLGGHQGLFKYLHKTYVKSSGSGW